MSNEIHFDATSGLAFYFCAFQLDGDVLLTGGASDETWGTGGRDADDYDEAMTEDGSSGHYVGSFASSPATGRYKVTVYRRAGANPADSDIAHAKGEIRWDGSAEILLADEGDITAKFAILHTVYDER